MKPVWMLVSVMFVALVAGYFFLAGKNQWLDADGPADEVDVPAKTALPIDEKKLGKAYHEGDCDLVYNEGMEAARSGNSRAQLIVGLCKTRMGEQDEQALEWLEKAAGNGEARAARELGVYYIRLAYENEDLALIKKACDYFDAGRKGGDSRAENYYMAYQCGEQK